MNFFNKIFGNHRKKLPQKEEIKETDKFILDSSIEKTIRIFTGNKIETLPQISELGEILDEKGLGICSLTTEEKAYNFAIQQKEAFREKDFLVFLFENKSSQKFIATIKGTDELDIIRWRKTNACNYDMDNSALVKKFEEWREQYNFMILGAGMDWILMHFITMPQDIEKFAKDVYRFCPDSIDQGVGDMVSLIREIKRMNGVFLWWD